MKTTTASPLAPTAAPSSPLLVGEAFEALAEVSNGFVRWLALRARPGRWAKMRPGLREIATNTAPTSRATAGAARKPRLVFTGGKIEVDRPRVRSKATGKEMSLPSWEEISAGGFLDRWAMNPMATNVATRKFGRAVRLPEAGVPAEAGSGLSKSAVSRRFKVLLRAKLDE